MKHRATRAGGGFLLVLAAALVLSAPATAAATLQVNNGPGCSDAMGTPYCTIQAAVNAASPGDIINVAAGTYSELVTVNKALTLTGAKQGVNASDASRGSGETIVNGNLGTTSF